MGYNNPGLAGSPQPQRGGLQSLSSYMLCSCLVLSFDACIVTITLSLLFVVIALWVICGELQVECGLLISTGRGYL
jgi:hypothetical protein